MKPPNQFFLTSFLIIGIMIVHVEFTVRTNVLQFSNSSKTDWAVSSCMVFFFEKRCQKKLDQKQVILGGNN